MYEIETEDILKAQQNSEDAMNKIIQNNSGLIWSIVNRFINRNYPKEDLYQIGCIGLIKAIKRFDTDYNVKITTYAVPYIMGEIKRFIRDDGPIKISRSIKELLTKINELQRRALNEKGEELTITEIAKELNVEKEEIIVALEAGKQIESIDEEAYDDDGKGESKIEKLTLNKNENNSIIDNLCLKEAISKLKLRERQIIILRYFRDKTQTEVATLLGISQVQVSRVEKKVLQEIRKEIA